MRARDTTRDLEREFGKTALRSSNVEWFLSQ